MLIHFPQEKIDLFKGNVMTNSHTKKEPTLIAKNARLVLIGSIIFALMGLLNIAYQFTPLFPRMFPNLIASEDIDTIWFVYETISYVLYSITFISLIPIGIGIRNITDIYFVDHITKSGKQTAFWIFVYAIAVPLDMITLGWAVIAGMIALSIIVGRVMAFRKIHITFEKIKRIFDVKIGSFLYLTFAFYSLIVMTLGALSSGDFSSDYAFQINLSIFNGAIESVLMILVAIKLIIDIYKIKNFVEEESIEPYSAKKAFLVTDRTDKPVLPTTKEHIQSKTQIEKLQERAAQQESRIQRIREREQERKAKQVQREVEKKKDKVEYIYCHQCNQRTDKNLPYCMNCGESLRDETERIKKEVSEVATRRILSPKREKILRQIVFAIFVIAFVTYAFIMGPPLTIYAWIIIAIFATYLFVNYIVLFFSGRGFAITTFFSDVAFLFIIIPVLSSIIAYFIALVTVRINSPNDEINRWLLIILSIAFSLVTITFVLRYKVSSTDMTLREYIRYRLDFKARAAELNKEQQRVEKKRANFDNLDRIEAHMKRQREEKVMDYKDFDYKERLKDLGSPLQNDDED